MSKRYALKVELYDWPSHLATALVNNDFTGCSQKEEEAARRVLKYVRERYGKTANIANAHSSGIFGRSDTPLEDHLKDDVATYTVLYEKRVN